MGAQRYPAPAAPAALDLVDVATGRLDCFWELTLAVGRWPRRDAGREAGGVVTTLDGRTTYCARRRVAGNPVLHPGYWIS